MICSKGGERIRSYSCSSLSFDMMAEKSRKRNEELEKTSIGEKNVLVGDSSIVSNLVLNFSKPFSIEFSRPFLNSAQVKT